MMRMPAQASIDPSVSAQEIRGDLGRAIERYAHSDDHARRAIAELADTAIFRPQTAEIRQCLLDTPTKAPPRPKCEQCGGAGAITVWYLVTYKGNSWVVDGAERIPAFGYEQAMEFSRRLVDSPDVRQTVLSAAEACGCVVVREGSVSV